MKKNVIIMGLALVILAVCVWIGCKAEQLDRIEFIEQKTSRILAILEEKEERA